MGTQRALVLEVRGVPSIEERRRLRTIMRGTLSRYYRSGPLHLLWKPSQANRIQITVRDRDWIILTEALSVALNEFGCGADIRFLRN